MHVVILLWQTNCERWRDCMNFVATMDNSNRDISLRQSNMVTLQQSNYQNHIMGKILLLTIGVGYLRTYNRTCSIPSAKRLLRHANIKPNVTLYFLGASTIHMKSAKVIGWGVLEICEPQRHRKTEISGISRQKIDVPRCFSALSDLSSSFAEQNKVILL